MANFNAIRYNVPYSGAGNLKLITTSTASSSATISFTSGIDSTYKEYLFIFNSMHPATDQVSFSFQGNAAGASGYNETITSTYFTAYHNEAGNSAALEYTDANDQAQGTSFQALLHNLGNDADQCCSGYLRLFDPSNTTFVTNFMTASSNTQYQDIEFNHYVGGYFNTTSAIDEIQFKMSSGNIDAGDICHYGIL